MGPLLSASSDHYRAEVFLVLRGYLHPLHILGAVISLDDLPPYRSWPSYDEDTVIHRCLSTLWMSA